VTAAARQIGVFAYGSLIGDPGSELEAATIERIENVFTPFGVEFARSSNGHGGAPTLVPVADGRPVSGQILVLNVPENAGRAALAWGCRMRRLAHMAACDTPDEFSDVAQHRRQKSHSRRKGADQREMTDPAISPFFGHTAMGVDLRCHPAAVAGTD
jgi:hypothetical protein